MVARTLAVGCRVAWSRTLPRTPGARTGPRDSVNAITPLAWGDDAQACARTMTRRGTSDTSRSSDAIATRSPSSRAAVAAATAGIQSPKGEGRTLWTSSASGSGIPGTQRTRYAARPGSPGTVSSAACVGSVWNTAASCTGTTSGS